MTKEITFMTTLYNEQVETPSLLTHVLPYVTRFAIINDGSIDLTDVILEAYKATLGDVFLYKTVDHLGSCELGRIEAIKMVPDDSWIIMLDADERFEDGVLSKIVKWINTDPEFSHMYFTQKEFIDNKLERIYQKVKVFKKNSITLPEIIHGEFSFEGDGTFNDWVVLHRKSSTKQTQREIEYLQAYEKLVQEGKIDEGMRQWFINLHYFVKPHG